MNIFGENEVLVKLSEKGNPLERLNTVVDWEIFRQTLRKATYKEAKGAGGRRAYDALMMFKLLILQRFYNLSDDQMEYQILDRYSFRQFLGLSAEELAWQMVRELPNANPLPLIFGEALANFVIFLIAGALIFAFGGNWPSFWLFLLALVASVLINAALNILIQRQFIDKPEKFCKRLSYGLRTAFMILIAVIIILLQR